MSCPTLWFHKVVTDIEQVSTLFVNANQWINAIWFFEEHLISIDSTQLHLQMFGHATKCGYSP